MPKGENHLLVETVEVVILTSMAKKAPVFNVLMKIKKYIHC